MTSLVIALPWSFITSRETIFEVGEEPPQLLIMPAARPATKVPCPRPSPFAFGVSDVSVTCFTTRPPNIGLAASTPESTIAIAGAFGAGAALAPGFCQKPVTPVTYGQYTPSNGHEVQVDVVVLPRLPLATIGTSDVIAITSLRHR